MKKTKIDWCDSTWNPVTGCFHGCEYCYARTIANRFKSGYKEDSEKSIHYIKDRETRLTKSGRIAAAPFPYGFEPTFHEYRLNDIHKPGYGNNVFVCSTADLFGAWVPDEWIEKVFDACIDGKRYLFLTKNPRRYLHLAEKGKLPAKKNFWYGTTVTKPELPFFYARDYNTFVSIEPIQKKFRASDFNTDKKVDWVIVGAETGNRKEKVVPEKKWIEDMVSELKEKRGIPIFMKESLRPIMGDALVQQFPW